MKNPISLASLFCAFTTIASAESPPVFYAYDSMLCYTVESFDYNITETGGGTITANYVPNDLAAASAMGLDSLNSIVWSLPAPPDPTEWTWDTSSANGEIGVNAIAPSSQEVQVSISASGTFEDDIAAINGGSAACAALVTDSYWADYASLPSQTASPLTVTGSYAIHFPDVDTSTATLATFMNGTSWDGTTAGPFSLPSSNGFCVTYNSNCIVPEPSSALLAGLALCVATVRRRR